MRICSILELRATSGLIERRWKFISVAVQSVCVCLVGSVFSLAARAAAHQPGSIATSTANSNLCEPGLPIGQPKLVRALNFHLLGRTSQLTFQTAPQARVFNSLGIVFNPIANNSGMDPITQLQIRLQMPTMGHGSRPPRVRSLTDFKLNPLSETFQAEQFFLPMGGCWVVQVEVTTRSGSSDAAQFEVRLPNSHGSH